MKLVSVGNVVIDLLVELPALPAAGDDVTASDSRTSAGGSFTTLVATARQGVPAVYGGAHGTGPFGDLVRSALQREGIAASADDLDGLVGLVHDASRVSHDTGIAIAGASAVAAAVSAGIGGADLGDALRTGVDAARLGARRGTWIAGADVAARIEWAIGMRGEPLERFLDLVGTSLATQESVPAAFGLLARFDGDGWEAALAAANGGGDTDTIAAMAGAIAGACGFAFASGAIETVTSVNSLELEPVVDALLGLGSR